jgi:hypothetical protein
MSDGFDFSGIPTLQGQDPGAVARGTVPSTQIAPWLTENIPADLFTLRGEAQTPLLYPNRPVVDPTTPAENLLFAREAAANRGVTPDLPLEAPGAIPGTYGLVPGDPIDLALMGAGGIFGGVKAATSAGSGLLRNILRWRLGGNPGAGFENVAQTLGRVAPPAMRPTEATAQGIADVVRSGAGMTALGGAKETVENAIAGELNAVTAANQMAAAQGLTGQYAAQAAARVKDLASEFRALTQELADATSGAYSRATGALRGGTGVLPALRSREAIYQDIQALLSPDQWTRWLAKQTEYAKGSTLERLFRAAKGEGADVLESLRALQLRARGQQRGVERVDPDLLRSIFRGGETLTPDKRVYLPFRLGNFRLGMPGTIMAGTPGPIGTTWATGLGAAAGAATARGVSELGEALTPNFLDPYRGDLLNPYRQ